MKPGKGQQIAPPYLVALGGAAGVMLLGAILPVVMWFGDFAVHPAGAKPGNEAGSNRLEFLQDRLARMDRSIEWTEQRIAEYSEQLARLREDLDAKPAAPAKSNEPTAEPPAKAQPGALVPGFLISPLDVRIALDAPEVSIALERSGVADRGPDEWSAAVEFVGRELQREDTVASVLRSVERHVAYLDERLKLSEVQKDVLRRLKQREADQVADIYARMRITNLDALQAENRKIHIALADEFRLVLNPTQAKQLGPTLYAVNLVRERETSDH